MNTPIDQLLSMPEGKTLEFKRDLSSPRNILKTLVAFANTAGGRLLIGVEDASREVRGVVTAPPIEIGGIQGISAQRLQPKSHTIDRRVLVTVHHQPTMGTDMDSIREGFF